MSTPINPDSELDDILDDFFPVEYLTVEPKLPKDSDEAELLTQIIRHKKTEAKTKLLQWSAKRELEARKEERVGAIVELYDQSPKDRQIFNIIGNAHRDRIATLNKELEEL